MRLTTPVLPHVGRAPDTPTFDYGDLPASLQRSIREQAESIQGLLARTAAAVIQIGLRLQFVRDRIGRDRFQDWLKAEFRWSQPTASNYMRAAKAFPDLECVGRFQPTALFVLARRSVPPVARTEAVRLATLGHRVTRTAAVELVRRHSPSILRASGQINELRRLLRRAVSKLSADDVRRLAEELVDLAERMDAGPAAAARSDAAGALRGDSFRDRS